MYSHRSRQKQPGGSPAPVPAPAPAPRKKIVDMSAAEFEEWARARIAGLDTFTKEAQRYRAGRNWSGSETNRTNQIYDAFLSEAADLLAALEEMRAAAEKEAKKP